MDTILPDPEEQEKDEESSMRPEYDFSDSIKNPYVKKGETPISNVIHAGGG